jgi:hypothetical protein
LLDCYYLYDMEREIRKTFTFSGKQTLRDKIADKAKKEGLNFSEKLEQLFNREIKPDIPYAVKTLTSAIKKDKGLYLSYQANIAVMFKDECHEAGYPISEEEIHSIANKAAEKFLNLWIK